MHTLAVTYHSMHAVNIIEKLDGFDERMKALSQHSSEAVRDKAKELTQTILDHDTNTTHNS